MREHIRYRTYIYGKLFGILKELKRETSALWGIQFLLMLLAFAMPFFYKIFVDDVLIARTSGSLTWVIGGILLTYLLGVLLGRWNVFYTARIKNTSIHVLQSRILEHYLTESKYLSASLGELKQVAENDVNLISDFIEKQVIQYVMQICSLILTTVFLCRISAGLSVLCFILLALTFLLDSVLAKRENAINEKVHYLEYSRHDFVHQCLMNYKEIKTLNLEKRMKREYVKWLHGWANYNLIYLNNTVLKDYILPRVKELLLGRILIYLLGGWLVMKEELSLGGLLIFAQYYYKAITNIEALSNTEFSIEENRIYYDKVIEAVVETAERCEDEGKAELGAIRRIVFQDVSFSYRKENGFQLSDISLCIDKGERIAIVGESGGGKSTVAELLLLCLSGYGGQIEINGMDSKGIDRRAYYEKAAVIRQDSLLLNMSIRENLLLGKYDAKEEELLEALKQAELLEYVSSLEEGLYSIVGENGIKLSGGQRQRLLLARMFLRNPDLYIFDEATSSLDHRTEEMLMESITRLPEDKLVFIITHRMPIVKICDRIYVIKDGKVEATGRHDRLMEESTYYRGLYEKQQIS